MIELKPYTPPKCSLCKTAEPNIEITIAIDPASPDMEAKTEKVLICLQCGGMLEEQFAALMEQFFLKGQQSSIEPKGILSELSGRDCEKCECTTCQNPSCATEGPCQDYNVCVYPVIGCGGYTGNGGGHSE